MLHQTTNKNVSSINGDDDWFTQVNLLVNSATNTSLKTLTVDMLKFVITGAVASEFNIEGRLRADTEPKIGIATTLVFKSKKGKKCCFSIPFCVLAQHFFFDTSLLINGPLLFAVALVKYIKKLNKHKKGAEVTVVYDFETMKKAAADWLKNAPKRCQNQTAAKERQE